MTKSNSQHISHTGHRSDPCCVQECWRQLAADSPLHLCPQALCPQRMSTPMRVTVQLPRGPCDVPNEYFRFFITGFIFSICSPLEWSLRQNQWTSLKEMASHFVQSRPRQTAFSFHTLITPPRVLCSINTSGGNWFHICNHFVLNRQLQESSKKKRHRLLYLDCVCTSIIFTNCVLGTREWSSWAEALRLWQSGCQFTLCRNDGCKNDGYLQHIDGQRRETTSCWCWYVVCSGGLGNRTTARHQWCHFQFCCSFLELLNISMDTVVAEQVSRYIFVLI